MCTVTYLPLEKGFILTSNRDESPLRGKALLPKKYYHYDKPLIYPKDPVASGTWFVSGNNHSVCLLNGGFEKHERKLPYRMSRGRVLIDFFQFDDVDAFFNAYSLENIEPFTLVIVSHYPDVIVHELVWDGQNKHIHRLKSDDPFIRASSTLYDKRMKAERQNWFNQWLNDNPSFSTDKIMSFHENAGNGNPHENLLLDREKVKTLSITSVSFSEDRHEMSYFDVQGKSLHSVELPLELSLEA